MGLNEKPAQPAAQEVAPRDSQERISEGGNLSSMAYGAIQQEETGRKCAVCDETPCCCAADEAAFQRARKEKESGDIYTYQYSPLPENCGERQPCAAEGSASGERQSQVVSSPRPDPAEPPQSEQRAATEPSIFAEMEVRGTVALDGDTRRACNNEDCLNDYPCKEHNEQGEPRGAEPSAPAELEIDLDVAQDFRSEVGLSEKGSERALAWLNERFGVGPSGLVGDSVQIIVTEINGKPVGARLVDKEGESWRLSEALDAYAQFIANGAASGQAGPVAELINRIRQFENHLPEYIRQDYFYPLIDKIEKGQAVAGPSAKCPKCGNGKSLILRDYEDGWRLACGANCGLIINVNAATGLEFDLEEFRQFFPVSAPAKTTKGDKYD